MPPAPEGYSVRPATPADFDAVAELVGACDVHDWGSPDYTPEMLRSDWRIPGLDLATDTWLVTRDGEARAYAWLLARADHTKLDGWGLVHPDHRGRGLGGHLVDLSESRAAEHAAAAPTGKAVLHHLGVIGPDEAARRLAEGRGFEAVRHFWQMAIGLDGPPPPPGDVSGITFRPFHPGRDDQAVHRALEDAFAEHWGHVPMPFPEWRAHRVDSEGFDPSLWFLAVDDGGEEEQTAGALLGRVLDGVAWVETLGVRGPWRGRGIGESLLRRAFAEFHRRGHREVQLEVDAANETGATGLYERVGMRVRRQYVVYEKRLR